MKMAWQSPPMIYAEGVSSLWSNREEILPDRELEIRRSGFR